MPTAILAAVALAPPPLNLFPPQGAPQPGNIPAGGCFTPVEALRVSVLMHIIVTWQSNHYYILT